MKYLETYMHKFYIDNFKLEDDKELYLEFNKLIEKIKKEWPSEKLWLAHELGLHPTSKTIDKLLYERCVELINKYGNLNYFNGVAEMVKIPTYIDMYIFKNRYDNIGIGHAYEPGTDWYFYDKMKNTEKTKIRNFIMSDELEPMLEAEKMGIL